jgi:hypothetical protein
MIEMRKLNDEVATGVELTSSFNFRALRPIGSIWESYFGISMAVYQFCLLLSCGVGVLLLRVWLGRREFEYPVSK